MSQVPKNFRSSKTSPSASAGTAIDFTTPSSRSTASRSALVQDERPRARPAAVTDAAPLARRADEARGKVWALDLAKTGIQHGKRPTDIFDNSGGLLDLYCDGERQTLSRLVLSLIQIPHASQKSAVWNRFDVRLPRPLLTGLGEFFAFILCAGHRACAATHSA